MRRVPSAMVGLVLTLGMGSAAAQTSGTSLGLTSAQTSGASSTSSSIVAPYSVRGKVLNGLDGSGVPRALVTLISRRVLTDAQGNFEFDGFTLASGSLRAQKPGYSSTADGSPAPRGANSADLTAPVELKLYPNGVVTGVVTGRDGLPVERVRVQLAMAASSVTGFRWVQSMAATTDTHGEYRFNASPGRYRVTVGFMPKTRDTGETVLPVSFPEMTSSDKSNSFVLVSGQERRVELQPKTGFSYPVEVKVEPESARNVRFTVTLAAGDSFILPSQQDGDGVFRLSLPTGTYLVRGHMDGQEASLEGMTRVTVTSRPAPPVGMQLAPITSLPMELSVDPAAVAAAAANSIVLQTPNPAQFNLRLQNEKNVGEAGVDGDVTLTFARNEPAAFRVPPGRYRLAAAQNGSWHVKSATMGQVNLLGGEVVIGPGAGGTPIRIVLDNRTGTVSGTVRLPASVAGAWVYLIAATPSLSVTNALMVSATGAFSSKVPIGSYHVLALDHQLNVDLRDSDIVKGFSTAVQTVEVTPDATATVQLDLAREKGGAQ